MQQAKVQLELDQDEVDNAKQELADAGGDVQGRTEELMKQHEAASSVADTTTVNTSIPPDARGLIHHYLQWSELHGKTVQLRQAKRDAESAAAAFTTKPLLPNPTRSSHKQPWVRSGKHLRLPLVKILLALPPKLRPI